MSYAVNGSRGNLWRVARLAFCLAVFACVFVPAGAARADEGLVQYASVDRSLFEQPALDTSELGDQRGQGLDTQPPSAPGASDEVAVILWDEYWPPVVLSSGSVSHSSNGGLTISASSGL